jgi:AcrR family transcriptional regulator
MAKVTEAVRAARRDQILAAALECFSRCGYHATAMSEVAAQAGVSKGTPYLYFASKEALFLALYEQWDCGLVARVQESVDRLEPQLSGSPRAVLHAVIVAVGAHVAEHAQACRVLMESSLLAADQPRLGAAVQAGQARSERSIAGLVRAGVAAGEWPAETDSLLEAQLITSTLHGLMFRWHAAPHSFSWEAVADALADARRPRVLDAGAPRRSPS